MRYHHCITCATLLLGCFNLTGAFAQTVTQTGAIMPGPVGVVAEGGDATFSVALSTAAARETFTMLPSVFTSAIT